MSCITLGNKDYPDCADIDEIAAFLEEQKQASCARCPPP